MVLRVSFLCPYQCFKRPSAVSTLTCVVRVVGGLVVVEKTSSHALLERLSGSVDLIFRFTTAAVFRLLL